MKKIVLLLMLVMSVSVANAWIKHCEEAVVILASENLTPKAKGVFDKYLGNRYGGRKRRRGNYSCERCNRARFGGENVYARREDSGRGI